MPAQFKSLILACGAFLAMGCSKDANAPDANTSVTGHWISSDTVEVITGFDVHIVQNDVGNISGNWVGKTKITNGRCDPNLGCSPTNGVFGGNVNLRVDLEILGAGSFTGQLVTRDELKGRMIRFGLPYDLTLHKVN
jgi:hypothetical protein